MKTSRPLVLALDSAGSACSAAVAVGEDILAAERIDTLHGQAEALMPLVDTAMRRAGLPPAALDLVVTTVGPGSFTGIRVGIAAARGIALAADAQLVGVTSFEAVAGCEHPNFLLVTLESRREDLFVQIFDRLRNPVGEPTAVAPADLGELVNATAAAVPLLVAGDAVQRALPLLTKPPGTCLLEIRTPLAVGALRAALRLRLSGGGREARPLYLRPPDTTTSNVRRTVGPAE